MVVASVVCGRSDEERRRCLRISYEESDVCIITEGFLWPPFINANKSWPPFINASKSCWIETSMGEATTSAPLVEDRDCNRGGYGLRPDGSTGFAWRRVLDEWINFLSLFLLEMEINPDSALVNFLKVDTREAYH